MKEYPDVRPLKLGAKNNEVPLVVLGYGNFIHTVEEELREVCPVWTFALPNHVEFYIWNGNLNLLSVVNMARVYSDLILKYIPAKKVILAGHSFFGLVCFEVAHQLKETGVEAEFVILIDTHLKRAPSLKPGQQVFNFCRHGKLWQAVRHLLPRLAKQRAKHPQVNRQSEPVRIPDLKENTASMSQWAGSRQFIKWAECGCILTEIRRQAMLGYMVKPLLCKGILIRVEISENEILHGFLPDFGWGNYFRGGLTIEKTEGDHSSMVETPFKMNLAKKIRKIVLKKTKDAKLKYS
jgi:thioesterase domain-containing protein